MGDKRYSINEKLSIPELANPRYADLSYKESNAGGRVIGGDLGDLYFYGYTLDRENEETILYGPELVTQRRFSKKDAYAVAKDILMESFASIGKETVEHS